MLLAVIQAFRPPAMLLPADTKLAALGISPSDVSDAMEPPPRRVRFALGPDVMGPMIREVRRRPQASSSDGQRQECLSHPEDTGEQETVDLYGAAMEPTKNLRSEPTTLDGVNVHVLELAIDRAESVAHQIRGAHQTRKGQAIWVFASARCIILLSFATSGVASQQPPSHCQRRAIALTRHLAGRTPPLFRVLGVWSVVSTARPSPRLWTARGCRHDRRRTSPGMRRSR